MRRTGVALSLLIIGGATSAAAQLTLEAKAGYLDRRLADAGIVEHQSGVIAGGAVGFAAPGISIMIGADAGKLAGRTRDTPDVDFGRVTIGAVVATAAAPWIRLRADIAAAVYVSPAGAQRWILPRLGLEVRAPFASIPGAVYFAGAATLGASSNGPPASGGLTVRAGVEAGPPRVKAFGQYQLDRLSFSAAAQRQEQWGEIAVGLRINP